MFAWAFCFTAEILGSSKETAVVSLMFPEESLRKTIIDFPSLNSHVSLSQLKFGCGEMPPVLFQTQLETGRCPTGQCKGGLMK